jgi:hypothetical protein
LNCHDDIDCVVVLLTGEAASQVGFWIGSGIELTTPGANETKESLSVFSGQLKF